MSFYLHLPSNVSPQYYPCNRISSYKTKLPKRFAFQPDEYEVAITEFTYVNSLYTFQNKKERQIVFLNYIEHNEGYIGYAEIPNQNYSSIESLLEALNEILKVSQGMYGMFTYDSATNKIGYDVQLGALLIHKRLSQMLGFNLPSDDKDLCRFDSQKVANLPPDTSPEMYQIFIYTDIVQPQIGTLGLDLLGKACAW